MKSNLTDEEWDLLGRQLKSLEKAVEATKASNDIRMSTVYALAKKQVLEPSWAVIAETPMRKIFKNGRGISTIPTEQVQLSAAKGEGESAQLVIIPLAGDVNNVKVTLPSFLAGPDGARIPGSALELKSVGYVHCRETLYTTNPDIKWWPDALMSYSPTSVKQGEVQPLWFTIWVPRDAKQGIYTGKIFFTAEDKHDFSIDLKLRVYNFAIPLQPACKTAVCLGQTELSRYYYGSDDYMSHLDVSIYKQWCEKMLGYRVTPLSAFDSTPYVSENKKTGKWELQLWEDIVEFCMKRGLTIIPLDTLHAVDVEDRNVRSSLLKKFKTMSQRLRERGWFDKASVFAYDEARPERYPFVISGCKLVREADPKLRILLTVLHQKNPIELIGNVDIWCPITVQWNPEFYHKRQQVGEEVWWYTSNCPRPPFANILVDEDAIDHRMLFWQMWQQGVEGYLFWRTLWGTDFANGKIPLTPHGKQPFAPDKWEFFDYPEFKSNGDGILLYPGKDLTPIPTIRLALIRDGLEDYDYFAILRDMINTGDLSSSQRKRAEKFLKLGPEISESLQKFCKDPAVLEQRRNAVAQAIEQFQDNNFTGK